MIAIDYSKVSFARTEEIDGNMYLCIIIEGHKYAFYKGEKTSSMVDIHIQDEVFDDMIENIKKVGHLVVYHTHVKTAGDIGSREKQYDNIPIPGPIGPIGPTAPVAPPSSRHIIGSCWDVPS